MNVLMGESADGEKRAREPSPRGEAVRRSQQAEGLLLKGGRAPRTMASLLPYALRLVHSAAFVLA